jgi:hypothetical protein
MVGGVAWVASGLMVVFANPIMGPVTAYPVVVTVALLLTVVGLVGLHILHRESYGYIGRAGFYTALVGLVAQILGTGVPLLGASGLAWPWLRFPVGFMIVLVGFVLLGAATLLARVLPRWYGVVLIILQPVSVILLPYGNVWRGLALVVLGYALWLRRNGSPE